VPVSAYDRKEANMNLTNITWLFLPKGSLNPSLAGVEPASANARAVGRERERRQRVSEVKRVRRRAGGWCVGHRHRLLARVALTEVEFNDLGGFKRRAKPRKVVRRSAGSNCRTEALPVRSVWNV
jgi:hypothetical protein